MATPTVDLQQVSVLTEIVVRAGNAQQPDARLILQKAYLAVDATCPDTISISTLFRPGATLDELAREGSFPNAKLSYSIVGRIIAELSAIGYELVLFVTPTATLPDHHLLAVAQGGQVLLQLPEDAGEALLSGIGCGR
jgi:hypothetical protein